jgi:protein-disulfide isomerase
MSKEGMSKRQLRREQRRRAEQRSRMVIIIGVVLIAVAAAVVLIAPNLKPVGEISTPEASFARPQADGNAAGDPQAPVKLEEFSDFQCPYCERFHMETEPQLMDAYVSTGKVYFVYRSFGEFIGAESRAAAEAAYCAGDQNKFWEMHDIIFANQTGENVGDYTPKRLAAFAEQLGLDMGTWQSCVSGGTYNSRVTQDHTDGAASGIQATPSFVMTYVVNGETKTELISGAVPFSEFQTKIDAALAQTVR